MGRLMELLAELKGHGTRTTASETDDLYRWENEGGDDGEPSRGPDEGPNT